MKPTPEQLLAVADWLDECEACGKAHEWIPNVLGSPAYGGTWADRLDGHSYQRRGWQRSGGHMSEFLRSAAVRGAA
jgi:hypothetical protein